MRVLHMLWKIGLIYSIDPSLHIADHARARVI